MIPKVTFPIDSRFVSESTVFAKKEIAAVAEEIEKSITKDKEAVRNAIIAYSEQFLPKKTVQFLNTEEAEVSYAVSHNLAANVETLAKA